MSTALTTETEPAPVDAAGLLAPRVLIVEDQEVIQEVLVMFFDREGFETTCVGTVAEALTHLHMLPDFVVLDLHLPDGTGTKVLQQIRDERLPIKVAVTTGAIDTDLLAAASRLKPDRMFQKPYGAADLVAWIRGFDQIMRITKS